MLCEILNFVTDAKPEQLGEIATVHRALCGGNRFPGLEDVAAVMLLCYISPRRGNREARRHVLLEGAAGTAKTEITKALARTLESFSRGPESGSEESSSDMRSIGAMALSGAVAPIAPSTSTVKKRKTSGGTRKAYDRVQGTPDLMPSSFLGYESRGSQGNWKFSDGPLLGNTFVFHVDEINRISPRTLSVLFEAMAEGHVTLTSLMVPESKRVRKLDELFVVATQNPGSFVGTSSLPEPLLDRFMVRISMPFLEVSRLAQVLDPAFKDLTGRASRFVNFSSIRDSVAEQVVVNEEIRRKISELIIATWPTEAATAIPNLGSQLPADKYVRNTVDQSLECGLGVRAGQSLRDLGSAVAWCRSNCQSTELTKEDVELIAPYVLSHRLRFKRGQCVTADAQMEFASELVKVIWR